MTLAEHRAQLEASIAEMATVQLKPAQRVRHLEAYIQTQQLPLVVVETAEGELRIQDALDPPGA